MSKINIRTGLESLTLDATLDVACLLIERHVETTNKEIKDVLRKRGYFATEAMVSGFMEQGYQDWGLKRKVFNDGEHSYYVYMTDYDSEFTKQLLKEQEEEQEQEEEFDTTFGGYTDEENNDSWARFETDDDSVSFFHYPTSKQKVKPSENAFNEHKVDWEFGKGSEMNEDSIRTLNDIAESVVISLEEKTKTTLDVVYNLSKGYYDFRYVDLPNKVMNEAIRIGTKESVRDFRYVLEVSYKGYPVFYAGLNTNDFLYSQIKYVAYQVLCNEICYADFYSISVNPYCFSPDVETEI